MGGWCWFKVNGEESGGGQAVLKGEVGRGCEVKEGGRTVVLNGKRNGRWTGGERR